MMWGHAWNMGWWWLFGLLLLVGIVLLIVLLVRVLSGTGTRAAGTDATGPTAGPNRARQILDERYAKGELTLEQYREQVQVLGENP